MKLPCIINAQTKMIK